MKKRMGPPASHLKIMIWEAKVEVYISLAMMDSKTACGEQRGNQIIIHPKVQSIHELLDTFCHEILHPLLDKYESIEEDERVVEYCTKKVMRSLTGFERMRLFLKLAQSLKKVDL